jgi:hypothetical protein
MIINFKIFEQYKNLNSNFYKWFGKSKTIDSSGYPIVFYHGTTKKFNKFDDADLIYFTKNPEYAEKYAYNASMSAIPKNIDYYNTEKNPNIIPVYLKIENIFDTRNKKERNIFLNDFYMKYGTGTNLENGLPDWMDANDLYDFIIENKLKYDGLVINDSHNNISYVVFKANQIKSAIGNNGNYDINNPDITK